MLKNSIQLLSIKYVCSSLNLENGELRQKAKSIALWFIAVALAFVLSAFFTEYFQPIEEFLRAIVQKIVVEVVSGKLKEMRRIK